MARVGLIVNPASGRDIRRVAGGASVSDAYAKRRVASSIVSGLALQEEPIEVLAMPDAAGIAAEAIEDYGGAASLLDMEITGSRRDTQRAADRLRDDVDVIVAMGGDGTVRDVALAVGETPVLPLSTGTNNVIPTPVEGTVAGGAVALYATGAVGADVTTRHTMVEATIRGATDRTVRGVATLGVVDRSFVGTRAVLDPSEYLGGVVSRASQGEVGLSGIVGGCLSLAPDQPDGAGVFVDPEAARTVRAITMPGVVETVGIDDCQRLTAGETIEVAVDEAVISVDGERHVEVQDATIVAGPTNETIRLIDVDAVYERGPFP
ncbi:NAD(+)/NADH kinase [Halanaeroarchaeum sulfurireducens]|uniref:ATP-NAD/AcoX kinase n=1 Tax=Halanaeroarchaeum sulfurireducens TaxID=1604004 RepID=A0A0F7PCK4_9EURY|nr:NAD(+)/NADH kinase [Halanaeroarchaeum sulfurireducens]AKH97374.1 ATP-NAD/AcoX kinase [Halanaeroarchaeum sulfurireducens]